MITKHKNKYNLLCVSMLGCFITSTAFAQAELPNPMAQQQAAPAQFQFMKGNDNSNAASVYQAAPVQAPPVAPVNATQVPQSNVTQANMPNPNAGDSNANISGVQSTSAGQPALPVNPNAEPQAQVNTGQPQNNVNYPVLPPSAMPSAPMTPQISPEEKAYNDAKSSYLGISPVKIKELHKEVYDQQQAVSELPVDMPESYTGSVKVSLQPGATPPVVRPFMGLTTVILFVDAYGNPWPVENFHFVSGKDFDIKRLDDQDEKNGSSFYIDAKTMISQSNVVFKLKGEPRPVVVTLLAGQPVHDADIEVRVQGKSPNAPLAIAPTFVAQDLPAGAQAALNPVLDGAPPHGGKQIKVDGDDDTRGWIMPNGHLVLRTPVVLISVARPTVVSSADGTHVYDLNRAIPTLKGTLNGSYVNLSISGY